MTTASAVPFRFACVSTAVVAVSAGEDDRSIPLSDIETPNYANVPGSSTDDSVFAATMEVDRVGMYSGAWQRRLS